MNNKNLLSWSKKIVNHLGEKMNKIFIFVFSFFRTHDSPGYLYVSGDIMMNDKDLKEFYESR